MSRTPKSAPESVGDAMTPERMVQAEQTVQELKQLQTSYGQGRDLVNQLLGQAQAFKASGNLLQTFGVSKIAIVKENKLYQQLAGTTTPNGLELKGTWIEFCGLLNMSDEKANQDIANLQAFGEAALEQMQLVGIGYRDLRQFRKLPIDQKTALIEAAKAGDKDTLLELAEDLIAKHAKEKEKLTAELAESEATKEAKDAVIKKNTETMTELHRKTSVKALTAWPERFKGYIEQVQGSHRVLKVEIGALDIVREAAMQIEAATPEEEASLQKAREMLATELLHIHRQCAEYLEAMGNMFDKTLGTFADEGR